MPLSCAGHVTRPVRLDQAGSGDAAVDTVLGRTGLTRHEKAFRQQNITKTALLALTNEDMKELGLTVGERVTLRAEVEKLLAVRLRRRCCLSRPCLATHVRAVPAARLLVFTLWPRFFLGVGPSADDQGQWA